MKAVDQLVFHFLCQEVISDLEAEKLTDDGFIPVCEKCQGATLFFFEKSETRHQHYLCWCGSTMWAQDEKEKLLWVSSTPCPCCNELACNGTCPIEF